MGPGPQRMSPFGATTLVVPCYDEGSRLDEESFLLLLAGDLRLRLVFVNDGSTDNTQERLEALQSKQPQAISVLRLERNSGKAEAVRHGLRFALADGAEIVGYIDADLATPAREIQRLIGVMRTCDKDVLIAARVALLGREIERKPHRHYLGRVFASAASLVLGVSVYDTQCGAKLFRRTPVLEAALVEPFISRWVFDVELLGRLLVSGGVAPLLSTSRIIEEPLLQWRDVPGSKLRPKHLVRAAVDLPRIALQLRARRRT